MRGKSDCTGFCTDSALPLSPHRELLPTHWPGANITHSRFNVIVPGDVLQRKRVDVLAGLAEACVPQASDEQLPPLQAGSMGADYPPTISCARIC